MKRFKVHAEEYQDTDDMGYAIAPPVMYYHVGNSEIGFNFDTEKEAEMLCEEWNKLVDENESKDKAIASLDDCQKNQSHSLNRLSMENKELKKEIEYLKSSDNITRLEIRIRKLKEENKKLQSEIRWENIKYGTLKILYDENKELKQFKEQVFFLIDKRIRTLEANSKQCHLGGSHEKGIEFTLQAELLERLKKELEE